MESGKEYLIMNQETGHYEEVSKEIFDRIMAHREYIKSIMPKMKPHYVIFGTGGEINKGNFEELWQKRNKTF
jgi:hypothetical protein